MNLSEKEIKSKAKIYSITTFTIIGLLILVIIGIIFGIKYFISSLYIKKYYVLDINGDNKDKIIELFNQEKENIFHTKNYCDSMYKIEYYNVFPDSISYTMYCENDEDIKFSTDKSDKDVLASYIFENGYIEKR